MSACYLRAEAVNLASFVYDCNDLSTVRGGGLILLDLWRKIVPIVGAEPLIRGASQALFWIENCPDPEQLRQRVERALADDEQLRFATVCVDVVPDDDGFSKERALARNRWRQMQMPSVVYPKVAGTQGICEKDLLRPAEVHGLSEFTYLRREFGREAKQRFYEREVGRALPFRFTNDLHDLGGDSDVWGNLRDKIAVIYLDGNGIGQFLKKHCEDRHQLQLFSKQLRDWQREFLSTLLTRAESDSKWHTKNNQLRMETLLWGGDEMLLVVPAWCGWDALDLFYRKDRTWREEVTFSGGLVFCHLKSPIHSVKSLAKRIADGAKEVGKQSGGKSLFAFQVLESFDHVGSVVGEARKVLAGASMESIAETMPAVRRVVSRKKLHEGAKALMRGDLKAANEVTQYVLKSTEPELPEAKRCFGALRNDWETNPDFWFALAELWDYIAPEKVG